MIEFLKDYKFWTLVIAIVSLLWSACNFIIGKLIANKIQGNDLKHLTADVIELKSKDEKRTDKIYKVLNRIDKKLSNIELKVQVQRAICDERHPKIKKKRKR